MPQLSGAGGGGGDPELCATDEMIPFKDEGDPQKEKIFAEISHPEEEGDLADIKSSLVNESEIIPASNGHEVGGGARGGPGLGSPDTSLALRAREGGWQTDSGCPGPAGVGVWRPNRWFASAPSVRKNPALLLCVKTLGLGV